MLPEGSVARPAWTDTVSGRQLNDEERQREARWWYEQQSSARGLLVVSGLLLLIAAVIAAIGMRLVLGQRRLRGRLEAIMPYWRGLPPISPGAAALVYDIANGVTADKRLGGRQLGATMLSLVTKGFARMYPGPVERYRGIDLLRTDATTLARMASARGAGDDDTTSTIVLLPRAFDMASCQRQLCMSERAALDMLRATGQRLGSVVFDTRQCAQCLGDGDDARELSRSFHERCIAEMGELGVFPKRAMGARVCHPLLRLRVPRGADMAVEGRRCAAADRHRRRGRRRRRRAADEADAVRRRRARHAARGAGARPRQISRGLQPFRRPWCA